jgi:hypothetical protein
MRWAKQVACMGEMRNAYKIVAAKSDRKRPVGRPRHIWEDNIKMDLGEKGFNNVDWINLSQNGAS